MALCPYNHKMGHKLRTDAGGVAVDRGFIAHFEIPEDDAPAASSTGVAVITLGAAAQDITAGITNPVVPRALRVLSNKSNGAGNVVIAGTNIAGEPITETLALNGTTIREGNKAFGGAVSITVPARVNTPVAQVETATAAGTVTTAGRAKCTVTAAGMPGSPLHVPFDVELTDGAEEIAAALRAALAEVEVITDRFDVSGEGAAVILTAKVAAANDATLNIATGDGEGEGASVGVTTAAASANTTDGVAPDAVSVGWNDKLGLPYKLARNTVLAAYLDNARETTAPTATVSATAIELNTVDLHSALNDRAVVVDLIV